MDLALKDQVALLTGASRGLGRAAAEAMAQEGAKVALVSRTPDVLRAADEIHEATGAETLGIQADMTRWGDIDRLFQESLDRFGHVDILFFNIRGPRPGAFLELSVEDWEAGVDLMIMSAVRLLYAVIPHMIERGAGSIIANESFTVKQPVDNLILSNALRLSVIGLVKSLSAELGPKGIRVNSINPSWTMTSRVVELLEDRARREGISVEEATRKITSSSPLGRMGTVEEYGRMVAWLVSPAASYLNGQTFFFDGGFVQAPL